MPASNERPQEDKFLRRCIDFVFGIENKKGQVLDYWIYPAEVKISSKEFYDTVERQLAARKIPGMKIGREEFGAGGLLSDRRIYLHLMRERLAITACAAPFGNLFFFSCRTVYVPALVRLWHVLAVLWFFFLITILLIIPLGLVFGIIAMIGLAFALAAVLRNTSRAHMPDLDALLLRMPLISTIYESWFRDNTYYREDTRNLYVKLLPQFIRELAEDACAAKGVKLEPHLQRVAPAVDLSQSPTPPPPEGVPVA